jgi:hypothetical protein
MCVRVCSCCLYGLNTLNIVYFVIVYNTVSHSTDVRGETWSSPSGHSVWENSSTSTNVMGSPGGASGAPGWEESSPIHIPNSGVSSPPSGRRSAGRCTKLFVGGINPITTERTLSRYFVRFGRLVDCFIAKTPGGALLACMAAMLSLFRSQLNCHYSSQFYYYYYYYFHYYDPDYYICT